MIVGCGEEIILGTFIATKLDPDMNTEALKNSFTEITRTNNPDLEILYDKGFYHLERYYAYCAEYGIEQAKKNLVG